MPAPAPRACDDEREPVPPRPPAAVDLSGTPIALMTAAEAATYLVEVAIAGTAGLPVHLCNAYTMALAETQPRYKAMLHGGLNLADGMSVILAMRALGRGRNLRYERVAGPDLFEHTFDAGQQKKIRHYLLGSTPEVLDRLSNALLERYPAAIINVESPPFRQLAPAEFDEQVERIREIDPHIVWIGLGTPQQDWSSTALAQRLPMVCVAIGAAFEFSAGTKPRAPEWMQRRGFEWLHRIASEPQRLWRRYLFCLPIMTRAAVRSLIESRRSAPPRT